MNLRRDKGLCFTCDEKYTFNHKCPNKHYLINQCEDEGTTFKEPESHFEEIKDQPASKEEITCP